MKKTLFIAVLTAGIIFTTGAQNTVSSAAPATPGWAVYQEGIASWYGAEFEGRPTSSGEIFNASLLTAAHPTLPFGTMLRVTNKQNNKSVMVRVNDRGPFVAARIIDISRGAAEKLDMIKTGTAPVTVEITAGAAVAKPAAPAASVPAASAPAAGTPIDSIASQPGGVVQLRPASVEPVSGPMGTVVPAAKTAAQLKPAIPETATGKQYRVQVGAYKQPRNAMEAFERLKAAGLNPAYEKYDDYYRVVLAGLHQEELKTLAEKLGTAGFREAVLREEN